MGSVVSCCLDTYDVTCCILHCGKGFSLDHSVLYYCPSCLTPFLARLAARRISVDDVPDAIKHILDENGQTKDEDFYHEKIDINQHNWSAKEKAPCAIIENDGELAKIEKSTNFKCTVIRGKNGYTRGIHVWEIYWPRKDRDQYSCIGVATKDASLFEEIGSNSESWGWNLYRNEIRMMAKYFPSLHSYDDWFSKLTPSKLHLILDMEKKTLAFMAYGKYLGIACNNLDADKPLYLAMSGQKCLSGVSTKYLGHYYTF